MKKFNFSKGLVIGLLTLALCLTCFGVAKVSAAAPAAQSATYNPQNDTITATTASQVFILKAEKDNKLKAGATGIDLDANVPVALADLGIKGTTKDVFLYVCAKTDIDDEGGVTVNANLVIKAQEAKKIVGQINYPKADAGQSDFLSATVTDAKGNEISNPVIYWWDGESEAGYAPANTFTSAMLSEMLETGGTIYIKQLGTATQFSSKPVKVKIAKQAKAPKLKIDVKKDTIALKNGFDFCVATGEEGDYSYGAWKTILPYLKDAKIKTADASIVTTASYVPVDKKSDDAKTAYTQYKFKALSLTEIASASLLNQSGDYKLAVRKSATEKKPASAAQVIEIAAPAQAPIVYTRDLVSTEYLVGSVAATDYAKKGIVIGEIKNYPGLDGNGALATSGFWTNFTVSESGTGKDETASSYEYCVVKQADLANVDFTTVSWKKIVPGKTKITSKLKSTYFLEGGTKKITAELKPVAAPNNFAPSTTEVTGSNLLLIRRAGTKEGVRGSEYVKLYVVKNGNDVELYSTVALGETAAKYTINFATYKYTAGDAAKTGWFVDDKIPEVIGYYKAATKAEIPSLEGADYFTTTDGSNSDKVPGAKVTPDGEGKVDVAYNANGTTVTYAIMTYANVKVNAVFGTVSGNPSAFSKVSAIDAQELATVSAGKIGTATVVSGYVGKEFSIDITDPTTISNDNYAILGTQPTNWPQVVATGTGYIAGAYASGPVVKVTPTKADEITVNVQYAVVRQYKVTYADGNGYTVAVTKKADGAAVSSGSRVEKDTVLTVTVTFATAPENGKAVTINGNAAGTGDGSKTAFTLDLAALAGDINGISVNVAQ